MKYICLGKLLNTHGLKGELKIYSYSDFDDERFKVGNTLYIKEGEEYLPFVVATYRRHKDFPLVSFKDYQDINLIEQYKGNYIYINEEDRPALPDGRYYRPEIIGLNAFDEEGNALGKIISIEETNGAQNNMRLLKENEEEVLIPFVEAFIKEVNVEEGTIIIRVVEGLL